MPTRKTTKKATAPQPRVDNYAREIALETARQVPLMETRLKNAIEELAGIVRPFARQMNDFGISLQEVKEAVKGDEWGRDEGLIKKIRRIEGQLHGTQEKPRDGLFSRVEAVEVDIRGDGDEHPGLGTRLKAVEDTIAKVFNRVLLYVVLAALMGSGLGATGSDVAKDVLGAGWRAIVSDIGGAVAAPAMGHTEAR